MSPVSTDHTMYYLFGTAVLPYQIQGNIGKLTINGRPLDFHPDQFYKAYTSTGADHDCHSGKGAAGVYGAETSDCDSPISLLNATFDWIKNSGIRDDIDFVIWTGDNARHDSDENIPRSSSQVLGTNRLVADLMAETFSNAKGLSVPVIPTFGNNDILPHNVLMPGPNKWLSYYADIWRKFIPEEQHHGFEYGGWFYVEVIPNKLAVFSLNTLYFFDRNAAIDDCVHTSQPGFKHFEWLRIQLQLMRERGVKAILMGHVPPARTESKVLWEESCWQKYNLWLQQYRDVIISGLYGHMNIDHFLLIDTKEIDIEAAGVVAEDESAPRGTLDDALSIQSAAEYLEELRDDWSKLPKPELYSNSDSATGQTNKKKKKGKKGKGKQKLGGPWAERYHLALVSPSIVPNYFPTLRVFDYNITGLENAVAWADYTPELPTIDEIDDGMEEPVIPESELSDLSVDELPDVDAVDTDTIEESKHKKHKGKKNKKKKGKGKGKGKKHEHDKDPNLVVPLPPAKSSPPGPAYSPQPLTLLGFQQYFANLTYINNDITEKTKDVDTERWRDGKYGDKKPKSKPKPRDFRFEIEYSTYDDKIYDLPDLTVKSFVDLAYRMGQTAKAKSDELALPGGDISKDLNDIEVEDQDEDLVQDESDTDGEDESDEDAENEESDNVEAEKKTKGKKDKKKKKKKAKNLNKTWLHFLKHAFVSTVDDDDLRGEFS